MNQEQTQPMNGAHAGTSLVATDRPGRYAEQMAKHFGHKCSAEWSGERGFVNFEGGRCEMLATSRGLTLRVFAATSEALERVESVVQRHLERWGEKDQLRVTWTHDAA